MDSFNNILQNIKKRPTLYLARHSIFDFQSFYIGYVTAQQCFNLIPSEEQQKFGDFLNFNKYYRY